MFKNKQQILILQKKPMHHTTSVHFTVAMPCDFVYEACSCRSLWEHNRILQNIKKHSFINEETHKNGVISKQVDNSD